MPRWECPNGKHPAAIGPMRPHMDHLCRYCLACSAGAGRLIRRTCPVVEKKRAEKVERRKERRAEQAAKQLQERATYPWSLLGWARKWAKLKAWDVDLSEVEVRIRRGRSEYSSGVYYGRYLVVTAGLNQADAMETLLHELAHGAAGRFSRRTRTVIDAHGTQFRFYLLAAAAEVVGHRIEVGKPNASMREVDHAVRAALDAWLTSELLKKHNAEVQP